MRHLRGEPVVVAVADLVGRHGVVLVDDRHDAEAEQHLEGAAGVEVAPAVLAVLEGEQHLRGGDAVGGEHGLVGLGEPDLADRGGGLALLERERAPFGRPSMRRPSAIEPEETSITALPRPCRAATSAARPSSQSTRSRPVPASTSSAEPILTTMRARSEQRAEVAAPGASVTAATARPPARCGGGARVDPAPHRAQDIGDAVAAGRETRKTGPATGTSAARTSWSVVSSTASTLESATMRGLPASAAAVGGELALDHPEVGDRVLGGGVDEVQEHGAALDMAEEGVAEAPALVRALDQARDVGEHELGAVDADDAELGAGW
jgi:hypothetical protein